MLKNIWIFLILTHLISCNKNEVEVCTNLPEAEQWERFVGDYFVYDTLGIFKYQMEINHIFSDSPVNGVGIDSLYIENLNNQFSFNFKYKNKQTDGYFDIGPINPLISETSNNFYFWHNADDPETPQIENYLANDTIYLSYLLDNTPYWVQDGVPFFNCDCREIAVKQN